MKLNKTDITFGGYVDHYFSDHQELSKNRREIPFRFLRCDYLLQVDDGVFSNKHVDTGTAAMLKVIAEHELKGKALDMGCGYGVIGVVLNDVFPELIVDGVDINPRAVDLAKENYQKYHVSGDLRQSDGVGKKEVYDIVITNPPIRVGKKKMYSLFEEAYEALKPKGELWYVIRKQHGAKSAEKFIRALFGQCELKQRDKGFYIYRALKD